MYRIVVIRTSFGDASLCVCMHRIWCDFTRTDNVTVFFVFG